MFSSNFNLTVCFWFKEQCHTGDKRPLQGECEWYSYCLEGRYVAMRCAYDKKGTRMMFNPESRNCTENIKLSIKGKCHSYHECRADETVSPFMKWSEVKCHQKDQSFDQNRQECVQSSNSTCGTLFSY